MQPERSTRDRAARLIAAAQAGDERAFRELVEPHRRALEVHCYRMLGSLHDAEDVVQETLLRAWRSLERFERRSSIETWLYRIATNACLDELERRPRRPGAASTRTPTSGSSEAETPIVDPAARYAHARGDRARLPDRDPAAARPPAGDPDPARRARLDRAPRSPSCSSPTVAAVNSALQRARATIDAELPGELADRRGADAARAARPLRRRVGARRHRRPRRAAARGRRADDAAAAVDHERRRDRRLLRRRPLPPGRRPRPRVPDPGPTAAPRSRCTRPPTTGRRFRTGCSCSRSRARRSSALDAFIDPRLVALFRP